MSPVVQKAIDAITDRTNLMTGLTHSNDKSAAIEMFLKLHEAGEILVANEIESYASSKQWQPGDSTELALLGAQIGMGKKPRIQGGPWWKDGLVEKWQAECNDV